MKRILTVSVIAVAQLVLVGVGVAPQLSARLIGDSYLIEVAPLDPIDPFRGAYVALDYPSLRHDSSSSDEHGDIFVTLAQEGEVWVARDWSRERPDEGPYLACDDRDWLVRCGIESFFLPQDKAAETEILLRDGAVAEVRIDSRGNATVVDVRAP